MKRIKELLLSVHQKYLYAAIVAALVTLALAIVDLSSPFFVTLFITFIAVLYATARGAKSQFWYLLPVGISSLIVQLLLLAIAH